MGYFSSHIPKDHKEASRVAKKAMSALRKSTGDDKLPKHSKSESEARAKHAYGKTYGWLKENPYKKALINKSK